MIKNALITGGAKRIGAEITTMLHKKYNVLIHYNHSDHAATLLAQKLNNVRTNSATIIKANLSNNKDIDILVNSISKIDLLINNAAIFYPNQLADITVESYHKIMNTNVLAPLLLAQKLQKKLNKTGGNIINIVDIHAIRPLTGYIVYNLSKAAIAMLTKTLAKELAPVIRVNGVAPGSILWPENTAELSNNDKNKMLNKIPLHKQGSPKDIAETVLFLAQSNYITGQIISVDGGRTLNQ